MANVIEVYIVLDVGVHGDLTGSNIVLEIENLDSLSPEELIQLLGPPVQERVEAFSDTRKLVSAPEFIYENADSLVLVPYCTGNIKVINRSIFIRSRASDGSCDSMDPLSSRILARTHYTGKASRCLGVSMYHLGNAIWNCAFELLARRAWSRFSWNWKITGTLCSNSQIKRECRGHYYHARRELWTTRQYLCWEVGTSLAREFGNKSIWVWKSHRQIHD
jgi:hypothetical protein